VIEEVDKRAGDDDYDDNVLNGDNLLSTATELDSVTSAKTAAGMRNEFTILL